MKANDRMSVNPQWSRDNPGWSGQGVPALQNLTFYQWRIASRHILRGRLGVAANLAIATLADIWNFYLWKSIGNGAECPCCGWVGPAFLAKSNWRTIAFQSRCPQCDSRSRHRGLVKILDNVASVKPPGPILFFAPELVISNRLIQLAPLDNIVTTDFNSVDVDYPGEDIQNLSFADSTYALIICNHVLEHVPDDQTAIAECARVLKPGGIAVFTIPGDFHKAPTWHFDKRDSNGHYRHYGMDVMHKMQSQFKSVKAVGMSEMAESRWHVRRYDYAFICSK